MPRSYTAKVVALTVGQSFKWVDNLLSQNALPGVVRARQGVPRVITDDGVLAVEITRLLVVDAGIPVVRAVAIATRVATAPERPCTRVSLSSGAVIEIDVDAIERRLRAQLLTAMESVSRPRRGRPPLRPPQILE